MTSKSCDYNVDKDQCQAPSQIIVPDQNLNIEASEKLSLQKAQFDQAASSRGLEEADLKTQQSLNTNDTNHSYIHDVDDSNSANAPFKWSRSTITQSVKDLSATISTLVWEEYRSPRNKKLKGSELKLGQQGANDVSVGKLTVHLIDAYRTDVKDAADGDYFATCAIVDSDGTVTHNSVLLEEDTHMIYSSAAPVFNCKFEFEVPHFRCAVRFWLIDGNSGRKVGTSFISVHAIIQVLYYDIT